MFILNWTRYIIGVCRVLEDLKEDYANCFLELDAQGIFLQSRCMDFFVSGYKIARQKKITRSHTVSKAYSYVINIYEDSREYCKAIDDEIEAIQNQIAELDNSICSKKATLDQLKKYKKEANEKGAMPVDCPARNFGELTEMIQDTQNYVEKTKVDKKNLENSIVEKRNKIEKNKKNTRVYINEAIMSFKNKVDTLSVAIYLIERDYSKVFQSCNHFYQRKIKNNEERKKYCRAMGKYQKFSDICVLCGYESAGQEPFWKEKKYINTEIRSFFGLNINI